jgi:uncharacterized protein YgfB (UPF0149 family)
MADSHTDYATLSVALDGLDSAMTVSELHGGFCGVLCAAGAAAASTWIEECVAETEAAADEAEEALVIFRVMEVETTRALASADLEFTPLLPEDDSPLDDRVEELALWCHAFLSGLAFGGLTLPEGSTRLSVDSDAAAATESSLEEITKDFAAISRAGLSAGELSDPADADFALAEIVEYVRVSAQIVLEEIADTRGNEAGLTTSMSEH